MLSYAVFCSFIFVQVRGRCVFDEFANIISSFTQSDEIDHCTTGEYARLQLPTEWTDCVWSCIDKGFEDIKNEFSQSNFTCAKTLQEQITSRAAKVTRNCKPKHCSRKCEPFTTGSLTNFLTEVLRKLQEIKRREIIPPIQVEVMGRCQISDFKKNIIEFTKSNEIEPCMAREYEHIHLPINWVYQTDCLWTCIDEGFNVLRNKFPQPNSLCAEEILLLSSSEEEINTHCKSMLCTGICKNSTGGNVKEFLTDVLTTLEKMEQKGKVSNEN